MSELENKNFETVTNEEIRQGFGEAWERIYELIKTPQFQQACMEADIDPFGDDRPEYWEFLQDYAYDSLKTRGENGEIGHLAAKTEELAFAVPVYAMRLAELEKGGLSRDEERKAKITASAFNGLIRDFAEKYPDVRTGTIERELHNVVNDTIYDDELSQVGSRYIKESIRGAQHELAFGQILEQTGIEFRDATLEEDMRGADYILDPEGEKVKLDVKASLSNIEAKGNSGVPYAERSDGTVVMYSHVRDQEFNGTFFVDPEVAAERAEAVQEHLSSYDKQLTAVN